MMFLGRHNIKAFHVVSLFSFIQCSSVYKIVLDLCKKAAESVKITNQTC